MSIPLRALALLLACCLVGLPASPADAASHTGKLIIKGKGSAYSGIGHPDRPPVIGSVVTRGGSAKYQARLVNYGAEPAQFVIGMFTAFLPATRTIKVGSTDITAAVESSEGYTTPMIEAGGYLQLNLKVQTDPNALPANPDEDRAITALLVFSTTSDLVSVGSFHTMIKSAAHGTSGSEVYVRQGSQPYVGGENSGYFATSPVVRSGGSAAFKVKFQNDSTEPQQILAEFEPAFPECSEFTATRGRLDLTDELRDGDYLTPVLAPRKSVAIKIVLRWTGEPCGWPYAFGQISAEIPGDAEPHWQQLAIPLLADYGPPA